MISRKGTTILLIFTVFVTFLLPVGSASAVVKAGQGEEILRATYQRNIANLKKSSFGLPLYLESFEKGDRVHVDVYGIFDYPFSRITTALDIPANWCDIVPLHPNVKACTYSEVPGAGLLTFYIGHKVYEPPEDARQVIYRFRPVTRQSGYLDLLLSAEEGPFGTADHKMRFEALPVNGKQTFVHVSYEYSDSMALRLAGKAYFATIGRSKVGFTVTGRDGDGRNIYITGPRGAIERSAVRYYFAIQSYMNVLQTSKPGMFRMRGSNWYDLTARYREQLFDQEREEYLTIKVAEHKNQLLLQERIRTGRK